MPMTLEPLAVGLAGRNLFLEPLQVAFVAGEHLDEMLARHAGLVDAEIHDLAFVRAHLFDHCPHLVAQCLDLLGREAEGHQLVEDLLLVILVALVLRAMLLQHLLLPGERRANHGEALEHLLLELCEGGRGNSGCLAAILVALFFLFLLRSGLLLALLAGRQCLVETDVGVDEAVDDLVHPQFVLLDLIDHGQQFGDRGGAGGDRLHHMLETVLDALGDLDFAFARQQIDRAHFAHIHTNRVGGAAEFGIDGGKRLLGLFHGVLVGYRRRDIGHQQRFGIRRLFIHLDAHVVDHADDAVDLLAILHVVRQVVVDFGISEIAALLAEHDQRFQPRATVFAAASIAADLNFRLFVVLLASHIRPQIRLTGKPCIIPQFCLLPWTARLRNCCSSIFCSSLSACKPRSWAMLNTMSSSR